uniref:Uncharacterized protein n=1 Tax=Cacopsylla melanoneura TaxID=428564 RepID=A0A8D8VSS3_9HEMI
MRGVYIHCTPMEPSGENFPTWVLNSRDYQVCQISSGLLEGTGKSMSMCMDLIFQSELEKKSMKIKDGTPLKGLYLVSCPQTDTSGQTRTVLKIEHWKVFDFHLLPGNGKVLGQRI